MSVPKAHVTMKLESLPKGLRQQAEAIIKKKFGLDVKLVNHSTKKLNLEYEPTPTYVMTTANKIVYNVETKTFCVNSKCPTCGTDLHFDERLSDVEDCREWTELQKCMRCNTMVRVAIPGDRFRDAYMLSKKNPVQFGIGQTVEFTHHDPSRYVAYKPGETLMVTRVFDNNSYECESFTSGKQQIVHGDQLRAW